MLKVFPTAVLLASLAGCASNSNPCSSGNCTDAGTGGMKDGVTLASNSSKQIAKSGQILVAVDLTLTNQASMPLSLAFNLFSVSTPAGLQYTGSPSTVGYMNACDGTASLLSGHSIECIILFAPPQDALPNQLGYTLPNGDIVSVPLTTAACSICSGNCVDLMQDQNNCGQCGKHCSSTTVSGKCFSGICATEVFNGTPTTCSSVCGSRMCYEADVIYSTASHDCPDPFTIPCTQQPSLNANCPNGGTANDAMAVDCFCGP
jgi:hypothetical protein